MALNENSEMITANKKLCKNNVFYCPSCKQKVCLKRGEIICPHFAHYQNAACLAFSEGETEEHLDGKIQLANYLRSSMQNVQLEAYLPHLQQRPDILFEKNKRKIAVEFQCSSIPIEKIVSRTEGYLKAGYKIIWILGNHFKYKNKLTAVHKACLYSSEEHTEPLLVHYDVKSQRLSVRCDFKLNQNGELYEQLYSGKFSGENKVEWIHKTEKQKVGKIKDSFYKKQDRLIRAMRYPNSKLQGFLQLLYENHETVVSIPKELYIQVSSEWIIQSHPMSWKYLFILWLESFPKKKILTQKMLSTWVCQKVDTAEIIYYESPQLTKEERLKPFIEMIQSLEEKGILKAVSQCKWSYQQPLKRYRNLEEKINE